jgi:hypothetical protein
MQDLARNDLTFDSTPRKLRASRRRPGISLDPQEVPHDEAIRPCQLVGRRLTCVLRDLAASPRRAPRG